MRPVDLSVTVASPTSAPCPMDIYLNPFNMGLGLVVTDATGAPTFTVQHTEDDVYASGYVAASGNWYNHASLAAVTAGADGNYAFGVRAIRLVMTGGSGTAAGKLQIRQTGVT